MNQFGKCKSINSDIGLWVSIQQCFRDWLSRCLHFLNADQLKKDQCVPQPHCSVPSHFLRILGIMATLGDNIKAILDSNGKGWSDGRSTVGGLQQKWSLIFILVDLVDKFFLGEGQQEHRNLPYQVDYLGVWSPGGHSYQTGTWDVSKTMIVLN